MGIAVGIDLGTSNSCVAVVEGREARVVPDKDQQRIHPSIVSFLPDGQILVGKAAKERRITDAKNTFYSTKRFLGRDFSNPETRQIAGHYPFDLIEGPNGIPVAVAHGKEYTLPEVSSFILRHLKDLAGETLGEEVTDAVVTVPANFTDVQRSSTKIAARIAGLKVLRILNEPTAAALAYGFGRGLSEKIAIYDYGGGTFDITILELRDEIFEVLATSGDPFLGGDDLDMAVVEQMKSQFKKENGIDLSDDYTAMQRMRSVAEQIKCQLSFLPRISARVRELTVGKNKKPLDLMFEITREEFTRTALPQVERSFKVCEDALHLAGITRDKLNRTILVGGTTRIPIVREMVAKFFDREPMTEINPDEVVAIGAAIQAYTLVGETERTKMGVPAPAAQPAVMPQPAAFQKSTVPPTPAKVSGSTVIGASGFTPVPPLERIKPEAVRTMMGVPQSPKSEPPQAPPAAFQPPSLGEKPAGIMPGIEEDSWNLPSDSSAPPQTKTGPSFSPSMALDQTLALPIPDNIGMPGGTPSDIVESRGAEKLGAPPAPAAKLPTIPAPIDEPFGGLSDVIPPIPQAAPVPPPVPSAPPLKFGEVDMPTARKQESGFDIPMPAFGEPPPPVQASSPMDSLPPPPPPPISPSEVARLQGFGDLDAVTSGSQPALGTPAQPSGPMVIPSARPMGAPGPRALLLDVTPRALGIGTAGAYCDFIIERNAPIPVEQTRVFTTSRDLQTEVTIRICQGESIRLDDNVVLGELKLTDIRPAPRGEIKIRVTFEIDTDGILNVSAVNDDTSEKQAVRITPFGGLEDNKVEELIAEYAKKRP